MNVRYAAPLLSSTHHPVGATAQQSGAPTTSIASFASEIEAIPHQIQQLSEQLRAIEERRAAAPATPAASASTPPANSTFVKTCGNTTPVVAVEVAPSSASTEPFAFADFTRPTGDPRSIKCAFDSTFFTPEGVRPHTGAPGPAVSVRSLDPRSENHATAVVLAKS